MAEKDRSLVSVRLDLPRWIVDALLRVDVPEWYVGLTLSDRVTHALEFSANSILAHEESKDRRALYRKLGLDEPDDCPDDLPF